MGKSLTYEEAHRLFEYEPASGLLTWRVPPSRRTREIPKQFEGRRVVGSVNNNGYSVVQVDGKRYLTHRVIWLLMTGEWPVEQIDHANRIKTDNRWSNLRAATQSQNNMNRFQANNTSGRKGVSWHKQTGKWAARIAVNGKLYRLGLYNDIEDAAVAYSNIARILHGEFNHFGD